MNTVTIIVPTIGRSTLTRTLCSFADDVEDGDRVVVVCDGYQGFVSQFVAMCNSSFRGSWECKVSIPRGCWGHPLRNMMLKTVTTDLVWTIDDDDMASLGALDAIHEQTAKWAIYRMHFGREHPARGITCWREKKFRKGDIGTPMVVAPPCGASFGLRYEGDWDYVQSLRQKLGEPEWNERIIAEVRP